MIKCPKTITLFTFIGTPDHEDDSLTALRISYEKFRFDKVVCAVHALTDNIKEKLFSFCPNVEIHQIGIKTAKEYNAWMVYGLNEVIDTEYTLVVQGDGFILNEDKWHPTFLNYDYIGSLWGKDVNERVGNGGFSLRSKKFLKASANLLSNTSTWDTMGEDVFLCRAAAETMKEYGIKYAPVETATIFSVEHTDVEEHNHIDLNVPESYDTFGFHGSVHQHPAVLSKYKGYVSSLSPSLREVYSNYSAEHGFGDKGTSHSYIHIYEEYITKDDISLLEIGVCRGHSIAMWKEFLPTSRIAGVDVNLSQVEFDLSNCELFEGDATSPDTSTKFDDESFDYIIDDGSHHLSHQKKSFDLFYPKLKKGGYYFVEDIVSLEALRGFIEFLTGQGLDSKGIAYVKDKRSDDILAVITK
jgi:hypothetical protein